MTSLGELHQKIAVCQRCGLAKARTRAVPGEGPENAAIMFIGEAPGWHEDQTGRPFVGPAGQFLEELLASIGLRRDQVYITNIIKSRPPANRDPLPQEIEACKPWLDEQLELLKSRLIVTLGRYSLARFFPNEPISKMHGQARKRDGSIYFAMYHPAAALHQRSLRQIIEADIKKIPALLDEATSVAEEKEKPQQLSLF